jgi:endonuclease III
LLWATAFLKSTNGVADKVSCGHFQKLIAKSPNIDIDIYKNPHEIASIIRQTSKWVKNTFVLINIFQYIKEVWNNEPSQNFHEWINFHEMGPKTVGLLFHSVFEKSVALPVDSHVWYAFRQWGWTNATTPDECSWQATQWIPQTYFIKTNDAIGSIRQSLADKTKKLSILNSCQSLPDDIRILIECLI